VEAKNYKSAKQIFMETKDMADKAVESAEANKGKMMAEVQKLAPEIEALFKDVSSKVRKFPRYPSSRYRKLGISQRKAEIDSLEKVLAEAREDLESANYYESKMKLSGIKAKAEEIAASIKTK